MFRCMSSTNCHSLLDVVLASNSLRKAQLQQPLHHEQQPFAAKLCGSQEQILKCSINRKRWQKSIRAQSSKHTTNQALQKPNKGLDWYHQQPQVPISQNPQYSTIITICNQALQKPGTDLGMQHQQQEMTKINQSSKQQTHYQSRLAYARERS